MGCSLYGGGGVVSFLRPIQKKVRDIG
jgi:hypothetical protein